MAIYLSKCINITSDGISVFIQQVHIFSASKICFPNVGGCNQTPTNTHYQEYSLPRAHDERISEQECQLPRVVFPQYWTIFRHHMKVLGQGRARHTILAHSILLSRMISQLISVCSSGQLVAFVDQFRANFVSSEVNLKTFKSNYLYCSYLQMLLIEMKVFF